MTNTLDTSPEAVERLREIADYAETDTSKAIWDYAEAIRGAADQIETLSAERDAANEDVRVLLREIYSRDAYMSPELKAIHNRLAAAYTPPTTETSP